MRFKEWDSYMIGMLTTKEDLYSGDWKDTVFINKHNCLQFNIKLISEEPEGFPNNRYFTGYTSDLEECGFEDEYNCKEEERVEKLKKFLTKRLLIFKPVKKGENYVIKDLMTVIKPDAFQENSKYKATPLFKASDLGKTFNEFSNLLINRGFVGSIDGISKESSDTPSIIVWEDENDSKVIGNFTSHIYKENGFKFEFDLLKHCEFKDEWYSDIIISPEIKNILFVGVNTYAQMEEQIEKSIEMISNNNNYIKNENFTENENYENNSENNFINNFIKKTKDLGLIYDEKDLINFHTAMKSSNLVILSGMSGTGKSKLVQAYGESLGLDDTQLNIIPVRPSWADDGDLLGYVDSIHNIYKPGDSGLINTLVKAEKYPEKIYIVCLDEMNLARVEHYFSQFLSVLEMDIRNRKLRLYNDDLENKLYNAEQYPAVIDIGENVIFVGTVNLDESTYHFSDKVLDRANVISLNTVSFSEIKKIRTEKKQKLKEVMFSEYKNFKNADSEIKLYDNEIEFLKKLHFELNKVNRNIGIGFRIIKQIDIYLKNIPCNSVLDRRAGFDVQVLQRILTKVRGPQEQWKELIGDYNINNKQLENSYLINLLQQYNDISNFEKVKQCIEDKAKELRIYGYTI